MERFKRAFTRSITSVTIVLASHLFSSSLSAAVGIPPGGGIGGGVDPQTDLMTVIEPKLEVDTSSVSPMGDSFNPSTGEITFSTVDVSIPGNSSIPVEIGRWVPVDDYDTGGPTGWTWNIPFIKGNYLDVKDGHNDVGWDWSVNNWHTGHNCSGDAGTVYDKNDEKISANAYWQGKLLHIPGSISETFLKTSDGVQITKSNHKIISCITNSNGQEGIVVSAPDGLKYTFNEIKSYYNGKTALKNPIVRTRLLMVSKIEDRFGNYVDYNYSGGDLVSISSSDSRLITINYETVNNIKRPKTVVANGRTWSYIYSTSGARNLSRVELPNGQSWEYENIYFNNFDPDRTTGAYNQKYQPSKNYYPKCGEGSTNPEIKTYVKNPNGLTVSYTFKKIRHNRSDVDASFYQDKYITDYSFARNINCTIKLSLIEKSVSGLGIDEEFWTYDYSANEGTYNSSGLNSHFTGPFTIPAPVGGYPSFISSSNADDFRTVTIRGPERTSILYIDRKFQSLTENMVLAEDVLSSSGSTLFSRKEYKFSQGNYIGSHWYKCPCGGQYPPSNTVNEKQLSYRANQIQVMEKRYLTSGNDIYYIDYSNFDTYGFAQNTLERNSFSGNRKYIKQTYLHDTTNWLLGLPSVTSYSSDGSSYTDVSKTTYWSATSTYKSLPNYSYRFNRWYKQNESYHTSGNQAGLPKKIQLNAVNRWIEYSNYKRGIPQTIATPQSLTTTPQYGYQEVDDNGWIKKKTDFEGNCTVYDYDEVGRLDYINPCGMNWYYTSISYNFTSDNDGISFVKPGMLKQTITRYDYVKETYFDSLLRPRFYKEWDKTDASTISYGRTEYNIYAQPTFSSRPSSNTSTNQGVSTSYNALGQVSLLDDTATTGTVVYTYLSNNRIRVNDYKGYNTTTSYLAYGSPEQSAALNIAAPESMNTAINYNLFGNITSISQGGLTENRVYDSYQNLCKSVRKDVGNSAYYHNALGQVVWQARGNSIDDSITSCDTNVASQDRTDFQFDFLGNVKEVLYGDSSPDKSYIYDKNSLVKQINAGSVQTNYLYNDLNKIRQESTTIDGQTFTLQYSFDHYGTISSTKYPSGNYIYSYPNALGQSTGASSYASNAMYYANGYLKSHNYGNGFTHNATINNSGLPSTFYDAKGSTYAVNHGFGYDANHNITLIDDKISNAYDLSMTYDGLDRLDVITDSYLGAGNVNYDTMGNITYYALGSKAISYQYNSNKQLDTTSGSKYYNFAYDDKGNVTHNGFHSFDYNTAGQMVQADSNSYVYDGNDKRVKTVDGQGTSYSIYSSAGKLMYRKQGATVSEYYYLGSKLVARKKGSAVTYIHSDYLGSPVAESNTSGSVTSRTHYQPFGETIESPQDDVGYTGHKFDTDIGLSYMQARYYDPVIGRFYSDDPIGFRDINSFNRYIYANNNPYYYVDPDGEESRSAVAAQADVRNYTSGNISRSQLNDRIATRIAAGAPIARNTPVGRSASVVAGLASVLGVFNESSDSGEDKNSDSGEDTKSEGKRRKNRLPDKGEPNTVAENSSGTTRKKYGPDGNTQKEWNKGHGSKAPKNEQNDHIHDYMPNPRNPTGRGERMPGREPRPRDLNDMNLL